MLALAHADFEVTIQGLCRSIKFYAKAKKREDKGNYTAVKNY